jgi:predicted SAM-dependent methyltransferase
MYWRLYTPASQGRVTFIEKAEGTGHFSPNKVDLLYNETIWNYVKEQKSSED